MEGPLWFQYRLLVSKKSVAHLHFDSNSKIRTGQNNKTPAACQIPKQVYLTLDCTFSVANDSNADWESSIEGKGTISKDDLWFKECFFS